MKKLLISLPIILLLSACKEDIPDPEVNNEKQAILSHFSGESVQASNSPVQDKMNLAVQYVVKGRDVYLECKVNGITFRTDNGKKQGKVLIDIDGQDMKEFHSAAFVLRDLKVGSHQIKVKVVSLSDDSYNLEKNILVKIEN